MRTRIATGRLAACVLATLAVVLTLVLAAACGVSWIATASTTLVSSTHRASAVDLGV